MSRPTISVDFDGVLHSYRSGWTRVDDIPDPPVPGAIAWLRDMVRDYSIAVFSSRSSDDLGRRAMADWLVENGIPRSLICWDDVPRREGDDPELEWNFDPSCIRFPTEKPPAMLSIDDRAMEFQGVFPSRDEIERFETWIRLVADPAQQTGVGRFRVDVELIRRLLNIPADYTLEVWPDSAMDYGRAVEFVTRGPYLPEFDGEGKPALVELEAFHLTQPSARFILRESKAAR